MWPIGHPGQQISFSFTDIKSGFNLDLIIAQKIFFQKKYIILCPELKSE